MQPPLSPTAWIFDPAVLVTLALLLAGYFYAIGPLRRRHAPDEPVPRRRVTYFVAGWATLALTLVSPLDALGRYYLFSAHTLQLFILITATAPLLMIGLPEWLVTLFLPLRALRDATRGLLFPVLAAVAFNAIILIWHVGPLYEAALSDMRLHDLENLSFLIAGVLTWWPVLTPMDAHTRMSNPFQMLYLMLESLPLDIFGATAIFAGSIFYHTYAVAPRLFDVSPVMDQAAAGALLAVPGNILDIVLMSVVFFAWITRMERAQRERERIEFDEPGGADAGTGASGAPVSAAGEVEI